MCKEQCSKDKFLLEHSHPDDFTICLWQKHPGVLRTWIAYRAFLSVYFFATLLLLLSFPEEGHVWYKNFMYYTYWSYITECFTFTLALAISVERFKKQKKDPELPPLEKMPAHYKVLWCSYVISLPTSLVVTALFWIFVYTPDNHPHLALTIITHVINSVWMLIDFFLTPIPCRFLHFYIVFIFSLIYGIFTVIYQSSGGTGNKGQIPIYRILDWREPGMALLICGVQIIVLLIVHSLYSALSILKLRGKKNDSEAV